MKQRTVIEQQKAALAKVVRAAIRLRFALQADEAINQALPQAETQFDTATHGGKLLSTPEFLELVGKVTNE